MKKDLLKLIISLVIFTISSLGISRLTIESNMEDMLPSDSESLKESNDFKQFFDSQDQAMIIITADEDYLNNKMEEFQKDTISYMGKLEERLRQEAYVNNVFYEIDMSALKPFEWAYLDMEYYDRIDDAIDKQDFNGIQSIMNEIADKKEETSSDWERQYITSTSKKHYMMIVRPNFDQTDYTASLENFYQGVKNHMEQLVKESGYQHLKVGLTGGAFIQDYESDTIAFESLTGTMMITLILILIIVILFFGSLKLPLLSMYPLVLGASLAAAVAYLIYGSLNMFSVSFALLLLGLGIDFAIHLITRYQEECKKGENTQMALSIAKKSTGNSIIMGAATTAVAFGAFAIAKFRAFEQMGVISAIGLIIMCMVMLILIPVLINLFDRKAKKRKEMRNFLGFIRNYVETIIKHPHITIGIILIVLISLFGFVKNTRMETELSAIYPDDLPSLAWMDVVENDFNYNLDTFSVYVDNEDSLRDFVESLEGREDIKNLDTILDFMPKNINEKLAILKKLKQLMGESDNGLLDSYTLQPMTIMDLPENLKSNFIGKDQKLRIDIIPAINIYDQDAYKLLADAVYEKIGRKPVGIPVIMNEITQLVKTDMIRISIVCFAVVFLVAFIAFKKVKYACITILPLILTLYITLGLLSLLNIEINVFSIAAFPLIIGIGIDSAIHLLHRLKEGEQLSIPQQTMNTGKAIIMTGLTTIIGFGSLGNINHPGMANLGLTVAIGMLISVILTLTLIPICFQWVNHKTNYTS